MSSPVIVSLWIDRAAAVEVLEHAARKERNQADQKVLLASAALYQHLNGGNRGNTTAQAYVERANELIEDLEHALREFTRADGRARDFEEKAATYRVEDAADDEGDDPFETAADGSREDSAAAPLAP